MFTDAENANRRDLAAVPTPASTVTSRDAAVRSDRAASLYVFYRWWSELEDELQGMYYVSREIQRGAQLRRAHVVGAKGSCLYRDDQIDEEIEVRKKVAPPSYAVELERQRDWLKVELRRARAEYDAKAEALGLNEVVARIGQLGGEINHVADRMRDAPIATIEDVAALLDVVLRREMGPALSVPSLLGRDCPWLTLLLRGLRTLTPDIEFEPIRQYAGDSAPRFYDRALKILAAEATATLTEDGAAHEDDDDWAENAAAAE